MTEIQTPEFKRHCAWSGEDRAGRHYILTTTDGQELVSEEAFRPVDPEVLLKVQRSLTALVRRVHQLESAAAGAVDQESAPPGAADQDDDQDAVQAAPETAARKGGRRG